MTSDEVSTLREGDIIKHSSGLHALVHSNNEHGTTAVVTLRLSDGNEEVIDANWSLFKRTIRFEG